MDVNYVTNAAAGYESVKHAKTDENKNKSTVKQNDASEPVKDTAATYEKKSEPATARNIGKRDDVTIERLKAEAEARTAQLRALVEKIILKQNGAASDVDNYITLLREGKLDVDEETALKAQQEISEDGYWGVNQTSDRLVDFAKALSGNDPEKADEMMAAIKKGYEDATKSWGDELPEICKKTLDAATEKLTAWRDGTETKA